MYFETYNGQEYSVFFGAVSKCEDISLAPATSSTISLQLWLCALFFLIIKSLILKKHFEIKPLFWRIVSPDWKDAINAIFQTLLFLSGISLKNCLPFTDNLWWLEFKFVSKSSITCVSMWKWTTYFTKLPILNRGEKKSGKRILYDTSLDSLLFFKSGSAEDCGLLSGNSLGMSILHEIVKSGSITFIVELRSSNICKVSLGLSFESLSSCHSAFLISFLLESLFGLL